MAGASIRMVGRSRKVSASRSGALSKRSVWCEAVTASVVSGVRKSSTPPSIVFVVELSVGAERHAFERLPFSEVETGPAQLEDEPGLRRECHTRPGCEVRLRPRRPLVQLDIQALARVQIRDEGVGPQPSRDRHRPARRRHSPPTARRRTSGGPTRPVATAPDRSTLALRTRACSRGVTVIVKSRLAVGRVVEDVVVDTEVGDRQRRVRGPTGRNGRAWTRSDRRVVAVCAYKTVVFRHRSVRTRMHVSARNCSSALSSPRCGQAPGLPFP